MACFDSLPKNLSLIVIYTLRITMEHTLYRHDERGRFLHVFAWLSGERSLQKKTLTSKKSGRPFLLKRLIASTIRPLTRSGQKHVSSNSPETRSNKFLYTQRPASPATFRHANSSRVFDHDQLQRPFEIFSVISWCPSPL